MTKGFTAEELAEMAAADAEIEAGFRLTNEELRESRARDKAAKTEALDNKARKLAASQRAYYEANREKLAASQRAYREANREKVAASQRAYYEANREKLAGYQRAYREANREKLAASQAWIQTARKALKMSQAEAARRTGISQSAFSRFESGELAAPMEKLAWLREEAANV